MTKKILILMSMFLGMVSVTGAATIEELRSPDLSRLNVNEQEKTAIEFLYAYMPLADVTDYTVQFHLENVRATLEAREQMPWGKDIPDLLFKHFVLPLRVNNEALDMSRPVFFKELRDRVAGMSMEEAILEVNHWCHEHVTYQPSDSRTLSPLACMNAAIGRCGEESTFTVAALRSIGIPARQVYTPRWAHTDDNHAWVEAWANGKWHFMGACEPEAVLDLGWFNAPASRALLMHTRAFGDYNGPEEVMSRTRNFTEINLIGNYAPTAMIQVQVLDKFGKPVKGARVEFRIYNYGEFYPAATKVSDQKGIASLTAGKGDMLVWASKDGWYGYRKVSFGIDKKVDVMLTHSNSLKSGPTYETFDIVPPVEKAVMPKVSPEMASVNKAKLAREDSIRKAYEATFVTTDQAQQLCPAAAEYLVKARGNWQTIAAFVNKHNDNVDRAIGVLKGLNDKDMRDVTMTILDDAFNARSNQLAQRVEYEMITSPFKQDLQDAFDTTTIAQFKADPTKLVSWIRDNIAIKNEENALHIAQTPMGVWHSRMSDNRGRDIFFVDLARSLNIESRMDPVTGKVQYHNADGWQDVNFDTAEQKNAQTGTLKLRYTPTQTLDDPKYYHHFSISRILDDGTTQLLNYDEGDSGLEEGSSWSNTFQKGTPLDAGTYMLTSGIRAASGKVLVANRIFRVNPGETTIINLTMRQSDDIVAVIGDFNSESKFRLLDSQLKPMAGDAVSILSQTGRGYYVVGVLGVGQEPTNHAMRDIAKMSDALDKWNRPILLLFENEMEAQKYRQENYGTLPKNIIYGIDSDGNISQQIAQEMKLQSDTQLPMFILADTFNRVMFCSQGYTIGLGEQLNKVISNLNK
ncbi:MAG: transglutaminase-like domain-containing protein [Bacteroidales bacterium]|nr:transglutaminase-like domain-containing protein [Bacteroidales bacterium]